MSTAMSKAESNALVVGYDVLGTHVELDLDFVKKYLVRGRAELVSNQELVFFMNTCRQQKLNPLVQGEVYLIKYSKDDPAQMVVGKDAYLRRAFDHPDYLFKNDGITVQRGNEIIQKEGCCLYPGETLVGGWCRVTFMRNGKERTAFKEVAFAEYNKGKANWNSKPATMINKVAVSQCVRDAFPKDYEGVYSEDEMIASGAIPVDYKELDDQKPEEQPAEEEDPVISQEQRQQLFKAAQANFGKDKGNAVVKLSIREWKKAVKSTLGIDLMDDYYTGELYRTMMERWVEDNVALIKTIPQESLGRMRQIVLEGYRNGETTTAIVKQIQRTYSVDRRHAQLLARDQIAKLNGDITQQQQQDAGVVEYVWSTSGDSRVRPSHAALNHKRFRWDDPPVVDEKTGRRCHPGKDYQCRCCALPVFNIKTVDLPVTKGGDGRG